jgi:release factor glutamine methyltransferase
MAMLPTPSTSHVAFERIYEPAEDSFLFLDTLSSEREKAFLKERFNAPTCKNALNEPTPFVVEIGTGSGVVLSFVHAHSEIIFGRADILTAGVDVNQYACEATAQTVMIAQKEQAEHEKSYGFYLGNILGDLTTPLRSGMVDILIFNPPYVPTPELPSLPDSASRISQPSFEEDSHFLALSYAGGADGMETTDRLLDALPDILSRDRGCAYILLCAQNKPEDIKQRMRSRGPEWRAETVGSSGKNAGWEKLQIIRTWREPSPPVA